MLNMKYCKKNIPPSLKRYTSRIFSYKCYFCNINLSNPKKYEKCHHHFKKESDGANTTYDTLVLACKNCHTKVHSKIKVNSEKLRNILIDILTFSLDYKNKKEFATTNFDFFEDGFDSKLEYLYFRKSIYLNLCEILGIIPTQGDMYSYDDDLTFNNYIMLPKYKNFLIKSILSRLDKKVGQMNIKRCHPRPKLNKSRKEKSMIILHILEWFDSLNVNNERQKLDMRIVYTLNKSKMKKLTQKDLAEFHKFLENNTSVRAKIIKVNFAYSKFLSKSRIEYDEKKGVFRASGSIKGLPKELLQLFRLCM